MGFHPLPDEHAHPHRLGFWGPRTASVDWCEPNYVYSSYVAEFWNTASSIPIVLSGMWGVYMGYQYGYRARFVVPSFLMIIVGLGSIGFHGTLQYAGQALDELSMVYAVTAFLFLTIESVPRKGGKLKYPWLPPALIAYDAAFTAAYVLVPAYFSFFVGTFILGCLVVILRSYWMYMRTPDVRLRRMFWVGFCMYAGAFFFLWIPDNLFCGDIGFLNLHAWFHVCGAIAPWWFINWCIHCWYTADYAQKSKGRMVDPANPSRTMPATPEILAHAGVSPSEPAEAVDGKKGRRGTAAAAEVVSREQQRVAAPAAKGRRGKGTAAAASEQPPVPASATAAEDTGAMEPADPEDTVIIMPELRWLGPRSLIMWPYVHLTRKTATE